MFVNYNLYDESVVITGDSLYEDYFNDNFELNVNSPWINT